jgi:hypothetical protein
MTRQWFFLYGLVKTPNHRYVCNIKKERFGHISPVVEFNLSQYSPTPLIFRRLVKFDLGFIPI